jgi:hydrogenase maturation factor
MMAVGPDKAEWLLSALEARGEEAVIVGRMTAGEPGAMSVL